MSTQDAPAPPDTDRQWFIVGRWQAYEGEARANLLRIIGVAAFYIVELANYHGVRLGWFEMPQVADKPFHQSVTALAVAWTLLSLAVLYCLSHRVFPGALQYITATLDCVLLTAILLVAEGPKSPLIVGYFLLIALATLRFDLMLIRVATVEAIAGYLVLLGYAKWYRPELRVPRYHQIFLVLALALTGVILGQVVRRVRHLAEDYARRIHGGEGGQP